MNTDLSISAVTRIAKRDGIERVSDEAALILTHTAEEYIRNLVIAAYEEAKKAGRKTLKAEDVLKIFDKY
ncbi:MAG TPA: NFYB/HAP3 family transcription factor subunit [Methanocorpusculum sp.]|nr:NFYB/HAP3 family transcription factor subunit [Methanocorpusculum sp.]